MSNASRVLVHAHNGRVDHLHGRVMSRSERVHDPAPDASPSPANETIVAGRIWTEAVWQIAPRCAGSQNPKDAVQNTSVVHTRHAARLIWQHWPDGNPFLVREFVAHDSKLQFGALNHGLPTGLNVADLKGTVLLAQYREYPKQGNLVLFCPSIGLPSLPGAAPAFLREPRTILAFGDFCLS